MDQSRRAVESYWRSRMIDGATSDEDKVTPVYKLEEICELLRSSHVSIVKEVSEFVLKRLQHKSHIVKQKPDMGGGATMRAVAKVAGIGVVNSGIRGRLPERPVSAATRAVARPVAAIGATSAADSVKSVVDDTTQKSLYEIDDWDFADYGEDIDADKIMPRVVFGGAPTFEEANEATFELKEVLEKAYLSPPVSPRFENTGQDSSFSCLENSDAHQFKFGLTTETAVPTHAVQAFKFLNESPAVQVVVASIASDPNVWDSVLKNPALQDYLRSQKIDFPVQRLNPSVEEPFADDNTNADASSEILESSSQRGDPNGQEFHLENEPMNYWKNIKVAVVDMVNNLSGFFQNLFGGHPAENVSADPDTATCFFEKALGPSLMGLVIMVIMVVVLKRP